MLQECLGILTSVSSSQESTPLQEDLETLTSVSSSQEPSESQDPLETLRLWSLSHEPSPSQAPPGEGPLETELYLRAEVRSATGAAKANVAKARTTRPRNFMLNSGLLFDVSATDERANVFDGG